MFRGTLLSFVTGWIIWFWLDKNPAVLGPMPYPQDGDFLHNFQTMTDLLKQARFRAAFVYIWDAHFLVLSLAFGLLLGMFASSMRTAFSRRRFVKLYVPGRKPTKEDPE